MSLCTGCDVQQSGCSGVKPKFHYADFATKSGTSSRQSRGLVADTNHVADFHDLCRGLSCFVSATKSADLVADFVADFPRAL